MTERENVGRGAVGRGLAEPPGWWLAGRGLVKPLGMVGRTA
jgi:hypothetical protein